MSPNIESIKCPSCGAPILGEISNNGQIQCQYCGTRIELPPQKATEGKQGEINAVLDDILETLKKN